VKTHQKLLEIFCVVTRQQTPEVVESHQLTPVFFVFSLIVSISAACHGNPYCFEQKIAHGMIFPALTLLIMLMQIWVLETTRGCRQ
jgi:hypothetical protein